MSSERAIEVLNGAEESTSNPNRAKYEAVRCGGTAPVSAKVPASRAGSAGILPAVLTLQGWACSAPPGHRVLPRSVPNANPSYGPSTAAPQHLALNLNTSVAPSPISLGRGRWLRIKIFWRCGRRRCRAADPPASQIGIRQAAVTRRENPTQQIDARNSTHLVDSSCPYCSLSFGLDSGSTAMVI
jgi:hypothetical protein